MVFQYSQNRVQTLLVIAKRHFTVCILHTFPASFNTALPLLTELQVFGLISLLEYGKAFATCTSCILNLQELAQSLSIYPLLTNHSFQTLFQIRTVTAPENRKFPLIYRGYNLRLLPKVLCSIKPYIYICIMFSLYKHVVVLFI